MRTDVSTKIKKLAQKHSTTAWRSFIASALASVTVLVNTQLNEKSDEARKAREQIQELREKIAVLEWEAGIK